MLTPESESLQLLREALKELESSKGQVSIAVQKLLRASQLIGAQDIQIWCSIQLGEDKYIKELKLFLSDVLEKITKNHDKQAITISEKYLEKLNSLYLKQDVHYSNEELNVKADKLGGGYSSIGYLEDQCSNLIRTKKGNNGTYYLSHIQKHIDYIKRKAHDFASSLYTKIQYSGTTSNCFDSLKNAVDDKLFDLNPELAEQLMIAFKAISSNNSEEWSQALTTCRRLLEGIADNLFPAQTDHSNGRSLGQEQYVNRLWAYMDKAIDSETNKDLAKTHVDYLGKWLEKTNKMAHKGVHSEVTQLEATKAIFHTYLVIADLLDYLNESKTTKRTLDINSMTIDELEAVLNITRTTAKAIVKARVERGKLDKDSFAAISGIGQKTLKKAIDTCSL